MNNTTNNKEGLTTHPESGDKNSKSITIPEETAENLLKAFNYDINELTAAYYRIQTENHELKAVAGIANRMVHDVKTPIRNAQAVIEMLIDAFRENKNGDDILALLPEMGKNLQETGDEVELYRTLFYGKNNIDLPISEANIYTTVNHSFTSVKNNKEYEQLVKQNQIKLHLRDIQFDAKNIKTNKPALESILINLIQNSIKAIDKNKPTNTNITIAYEETGTYNILSIHNMGAIPKKIRNESIFEIGVTEGGTGIGLYSAKDRVERLGGKISFTSDDTNGTTFTITLPK